MPELSFEVSFLVVASLSCQIIGFTEAWDGSRKPHKNSSVVFAHRHPAVKEQRQQAPRSH
eukprot:COSAG06_NODE_22862_length_710_cov_1.091653_1_plen_59_part_10